MNKLNKDILLSSHCKLLILLAFSFPVSQKISTLITIILTISGLIILIQNKQFIRSYFYPFLLLFCYIIIRSFYESNESGLYSLERKLSFLAFPIIFSVNGITIKLLKKILISFSYGCFIIYIISSVLAWYINNVDATIINYLIGNDHFLYLKKWHYKFNFSWLYPIDAIYYSLYNMIGIMILISFKREVNKYLLPPIILALFISVLQVNSIYGYFCAFTLIVLLLLLRFFKNKKVYVYNITFVVQLILLILPFINLNEALLGPRKDLWQSGILAIKQNYIFGNGAFKAKEILNTLYMDNFDARIDYIGLNIHNQYLQSLIEGGIPFFILILVILIIHNKSIHKGDSDFSKLFIYLSIVFVSLFSIESALNRYVGISIFTFFICISLSYYRNLRKL